MQILGIFLGEFHHRHRDLQTPRKAPRHHSSTLNQEATQNDFQLGWIFSKIDSEFHFSFHFILLFMFFSPVVLL